MTVKWKITAEYSPPDKINTRKYVWYITSVEEKSILWQNIKKKLYKCSWWKAYKEIMISWIFERFDKNCQRSCSKRG